MGVSLSVTSVCTETSPQARGWDWGLQESSQSLVSGHVPLRPTDWGQTACWGFALGGGEYTPAWNHRAW